MTSLISCAIALLGVLAAVTTSVWAFTERRRLQQRAVRYRRAAARAEERTKTVSDAASAESVLQTVLSAVEDIVIAIDLEGRIVGYNETSLRLFKDDGVPLLGQRMADRLRPDLVDALDIEDRLGHLLSCGDPLRNFERKFGGRWWEFRIREVQENGHRTAYAIFIRNITQRRAVEHERERFKRMADALGEAVVLTDANLCITYINPAYEKLMNLTAEQAVGQPISYDTTEPTMRVINEEIRPALEAGSNWEGIVAATVGGEPMDLWIRAGAVRDEFGKPTLFYGLVRDHSKEVARRTQLEAARQRAERANADKTRFLASVAHDLREPVNAANLSLDTLAWELTGTEHEGALEQTREALRMLKDTLGSALDLSRMELGSVVPKLENLEIGPQVRRAHATFLGHAQSHGLDLRLGPLAPGAVVRTDPALFQRILWNLLSNAVRYTPKGGILIGCRRRNGVVRVEVWDTGIGIAESEHQNIFDEHYRVDVGDVPRAGRGLGLAIVKRLSGILGIRVELNSRVGHGTCFACEVPLAEPVFQPLSGTDEAESAADSENTQNAAVDDPPRNRQLAE